MSSSGIPDKTARWLAYVGSFVTGILVLALSETKSKEVKVHAWQSIWFGLACIALFTVLSWFMWLPVVGTMFGMIRWFIITLWFILTLVCIISAIDGKYFKIPGVFKLAEKSAA